jgi:hypothetical protein
MVKHLAWDFRLVLSLSELDYFTAIIRKHYKRGIPKRKFLPIFPASPPTTDRAESFETSTRNGESIPAPPEFCIPVAPRIHASLNSPNPGFTTISSPNSSSRSSPPSPHLNTPPDAPDVAGFGLGLAYPAACNDISSESDLMDSSDGGVAV